MTVKRSLKVEIVLLSGICLTIIISHAWEWFHLSVSLRLQTKTCWSLQEVLIDVCQSISGKFQDSIETRALRWRGDKIIWVWCWQKYFSFQRPPWKCRNLGSLIIDVKWGENNYSGNTLHLLTTFLRQLWHDWHHLPGKRRSWECLVYAQDIQIFFNDQWLIILLPSSVAMISILPIPSRTWSGPHQQLLHAGHWEWGPHPDLTNKQFATLPSSTIIVFIALHKTEIMNELKIKNSLIG